jgi:arginyl-tRNA synthetase
MMPCAISLTYVNDAGRQMDILATSTYLRYLELLGQNLVFPKNAYQGDYVKDSRSTLAPVASSKLATVIPYAAPRP